MHKENRMHMDLGDSGSALFGKLFGNTWRKRLKQDRGYAKFVIVKNSIDKNKHLFYSNKQNKCS